MEEIEQLEAQIEALQEAVRRSRRLVVVGRGCASAGAALLACLMLGVLDFEPVRMILDIALGLGGLVLMGSSKSSTDELEWSLKRAQEKRNAAIDALELVQLGGGLN